jgi:tetratricopeptide (TPR) repeat protein
MSYKVVCVCFIWRSNHNRSLLSISTDLNQSGQDDEEDEGQEFGSGLIRFSLPNLRKYCRDPKLEPKGPIPVLPTLAPILMFKMFTDALLAHNSLTGSANGKKLKDYAAQQWVTHLQGMEKDVGPSPSALAAVIVAEGVAQILSNQNQALMVLEEITDVDQSEAFPSVFGTKQDDIMKTLEAIQTWVRRLIPEDSEDLPVQLSRNARSWIESVSESPGEVNFGKILEKTALQHMNNFIAADYPGQAYDSFRFAHRALFDVRRFQGQGASHENGLEQEQQNEQDIRQGQDQGEIPALEDTTTDRKEAMYAVAEYLLPKPWSTEIQVSIAMALRYNGHYDAALEVVEMAAKEARPESMFKLYNRIGRIHYGAAEDEADNGSSELHLLESREAKGNEHRKALEYFKKALAARPRHLGKDKEVIIRTYRLKAKVEMRLGSHTEGLRSLKIATEIAKKLKKDVVTEYFEQLVLILSPQNKDHGAPEEYQDSSAGSQDLSGDRQAIQGEDQRHAEEDQNLPGEMQDSSARVMALIRMLGPEQLAVRCRPETHRIIHEAAMKEGKSEELIIMYKKAVDMLARQQDAYFGELCLLWAEFARFVQSDLKAAKEVLYQALNTLPGNEVGSVTLVGWRLADMLLEEFLLGKGLRAKGEALDEMERLLRHMRDVRPEFEPQLSQMSVPLAIMRRRLGPAAAFFDGACETLHGCIRTLQDDLPNNDAPSFQVLAKVLRLVPGLEEQAAIAASCQFYIIDPSLIGDQYIPHVYSWLPGDVDENLSLKCSGCEIDLKISPFDKKCHMCCYCTNTFLCDDCYGKMKNASKSEGALNRRLYPCLSEHVHIHMPPDGWRWISNKQIFWEGKEDGKEVTQWLTELGSLWEDAWEKFWNMDMTAQIQALAESREGRRKIIVEEVKGLLEKHDAL